MEFEAHYMVEMTFNTKNISEGSNISEYIYILDTILMLEKNREPGCALFPSLNFLTPAILYKP